MAELFGMQMVWGYRNERLGHWIENPNHDEVFFIGACKKNGKLYLITNTNRLDIRTETVADLRERLGVTEWTQTRL